MTISLNNRTAIVCGSTQGIGKMISMEFAAAGANVVLVARNQHTLSSVLDELPKQNEQHHSSLCADFDNPEDLHKTVTEFLNTTRSKAHILINNTGGPAGGLIHEASAEEFLLAYNRHLVCNHLLSQAVLPSMKAEKYGRIINIVSTSVKQPIPGLGVSNTTRGAVASWAKTLSAEVASFGITVNNILPGATKTARLDSIISRKAEKSGKSFSEIENDMKNEVPAKRFAEPEEIGYLATFLASERAAYITGTSIAVDGGRTSAL